MKSYLFLLLCVFVIECVFCQNPREDWQKHYDDTWYTDELEKLGIVDNKNEQNEVSNIAEGDSGDSVETGDWNEELNLGSIETNIEEELKILDSNNNVDYQYEDNRNEADVKNENSIDSDIQSEDHVDTAVPIEEPDLDIGYKQSLQTDFKDDNLEENLQALPLPPVADLEESNDFSDLKAEASEPFEVQAEFDEMLQETKQILEETSDEFNELPEINESNNSENMNQGEKNDNVKLDSSEISQQLKDAEKNIEMLDSTENTGDAQRPLDEPEATGRINHFKEDIESSEVDKNEKDQSKIGETVHEFESKAVLNDNVSLDGYAPIKERYPYNKEYVDENLSSGEETRPINNDILNNFDTESAEDIKKNSEIDNSDEKKNIDFEVPTFEISKSDDEIQSDLEKLFDTMHKLSDSTEENIDQPNFVQEYEDKFQRPYKEGIILSQRENDLYYDIPENDENDRKEENNLELLSEENKSNNKLFVEEKVYKSEEVMDSKPADYEEIADDDLSKLFAQLAKSDEAMDLPNLQDDIVESPFNITDPDAEIVFEQPELVAIGSVEEKQVEIPEPVSPTVSNDNKEEETHKSVATKSVEQLTDFEYQQLMQQFSFEPNNDIIPVNCDDEPGQIIKVLNINETVEITSCNYPNAYPTNRIMEWVFVGEGKGFEFVIDDFDLNGIIGDYLLVKAEGKSSTGNLLFSYHLDGPKKYGFLDVERLTVTFEAKLSFPFRTGFKFTVKRLDATYRAPEIDEDITPAPLQAPPAFLKLSMGPVPLEQFSTIEEDFRRILADMATTFINANNIDPGKESTLETTQILRLSLCNMHWPGYMNCTEVKFGVALVYEGDPDAGLTEDQLKSMWRRYSNQDPFASRLRRLGISEFKAPDDSSVLMVWTVIACGVIISMAMLSFALWRFSCFGDYTRMGAFSDSESMNNEKRDLDLYPTPHQTLPPLFSDYMWGDKMDTTRVDMGGFTNKSYAQDDLFNIDSDEDTVANRDRNDNARPKDIPEV